MIVKKGPQALLTEKGQHLNPRKEGVVENRTGRGGETRTSQGEGGSVQFQYEKNIHLSRGWE